MKFTSNKNVLLKVLTNVSRSVSSKSNIPALEGINITVKNSKVLFEGFNMEFGIKTSIVVSDAEEGAIVVPAKLFTDIIKSLPESSVLFEAQGSEVLISCSECNFSIAGIPSEDFPKLPAIEDEKELTISSQIIKNIIQQTIFAVADNVESSGVHTGELWHLKNNLLTVVAVDGFRMAVRHEQVNIPDDFKVIIPGKALSEVLRLISDDQDIKIYISERYAFFKFGNYTFLSRLLEGNFIDYISAVPSECSTKVKINVKNAISSLDRVAVVINDHLQNPVKAIIDPNGALKLSCSTSAGKSNDEFNAEVEGEAIEIAFNDRYMIDALKNADTDEVILEFTSSLKPIKIIPTQGDYFVFLVLPVRMKDEEK
jgi:DNA polymerase-3 subunit beta